MPPSRGLNESGGEGKDLCLKLDVNQSECEKCIDICMYIQYLPALATLCNSGHVL